MGDEVGTRDDGGRVVARNEFGFRVQPRDTLFLLTAFRPLEELPRQPFGFHAPRLSEDSPQCVLDAVARYDTSSSAAGERVRDPCDEPDRERNDLPSRPASARAR